MVGSVNKSHVIISVFVAALFTLHTNNALGGWYTTGWGMTLEQVRAKVKENIIEIPEQERGQIIRKNFSYYIPDFVIGKDSYEVFLSFNSKKGLDEVLLRLKKGQDYYASFLYLEDELKKKYGSPSASKNSIEEWITKDTSISLNYVPQIFVSVIYKSRNSAAGGRL